MTPDSNLSVKTVLKRFYTKVAGVTKENDCGEDIQDILARMSEDCSEGTSLELEHEYGNPYDENAIKVFWENEHIGYIKRDLAETLVEFVDNGQVEAELSEITGGDDEKSYGCNILIRVLAQSRPEPSTADDKPSTVRTDQIHPAPQRESSTREESYFDGRLLEQIGWSIVCVALTVFTLGFGFPWACCFFLRWETKHTVINGRRLAFSGSGSQLFLRWVLWWLLTIVTLGIFGLWVWNKTKRWIVSNTVFMDQAVQSPAPVEQGFPYTSKDMAEAPVMSVYVRRFGFDMGEPEETCKHLFELAQRSVAPDTEVVTAFLARHGSVQCACVMSATKFIVASEERQNIIIIPIMEIRSFSVQNGTLNIDKDGEDISLEVAPAKGEVLCKVCSASLNACQEEIKAAQHVGV